MASAWFPIGEGPILAAAQPLRTALSQARANGDIGSWRIGDQTREGRQRKVEIIFDNESHKAFAKLKFG